jgi:hypothetical protein
MILATKKYFWKGVRLAGIVLLALGFALPFLFAQEQPRFTGTWVRNEEESDDPQEKMQAALEAMRQERGGGRGGRMPGGMGGRGGGGQRPEASRGGGGGQRPGGAGGFGALADMTSRIETTLENDEFHVVPSGEGRARIFYLDGKTHAQETPQGTKMETVAEKKGDQIAVEQKMDQGGEITTTYELAPDGSRMIVTVKFEGGRMKDPVIIRSVYDAM